MPKRPTVPVIVLTGFLGAGKTTLLNHLLHDPSAQVGVVVNDFGDINVDAGLVAGKVDEPVAISGGCICCLTDAGGLQDTLVSMSPARRGLDVIIVEASGLAEPLTLARMVSRWGKGRFRLAGVVDVVDAPMHSRTVDTDREPPLRYAATTLVLVNKLDQVPASARESTLATIRDRVHRRNPRALVTGTSFGRVAPDLLFDRPRGEAAAGGARDLAGAAGPGRVADRAYVQSALPLAQLLAEQFTERERARVAAADEHVPHVHAQSVSATGAGSLDPAGVLDFVENLPAGVYRVKAVVRVAGAESSGRGWYTIQAVGPNVYAAKASAPPVAAERGETGDNAIVAIGVGFDTRAVSHLLHRALAPAPATPATPDPARRVTGLARLQQYVRLHE